MKKTAAKTSALNKQISPAASSGTNGLFMIAGSGSSTAFGDYVSDAAGLDTYYRYFIEVPAGQSHLVVELFDADIGLGGTSEAAAGRDRDRGGFDTSAQYTLIDPNGNARPTQFTIGDATQPAGADNAWLTFFDSTGDTVRDNFSANAYTNNDGTLNWATNWTETNDDNSATGGLMRVTGGELRIRDDGNASPSTIEREANLANFSSATLTFNFRTTGTSATDQMRVQVSANGGGSWTTLETFTGTFAATSRSYNISAYQATNTRIRFIEVTGYSGTKSFFVDNVQIKDSTVEAGHWELRIDESSSVTVGDDINAVGVRAHDGTAGAGGTELNVYVESLMEIGVNPPTSGTNSRSYTFYPYISSGCSCAKNDFDYDSNSGTVGSMSFTSRSSAFTQNYASSSLSANNAWRRDSFTGYTTDASSTDYGIWSSSISISSYLVSGTPNGNYATVYMSNYQSAANPPTANPNANSFRIYLPNDSGSAPVKPYMTQTFTTVSGPNPPQVGQPTRYEITVAVVNPAAQAITFSTPSDIVTANVPGSGAVYAGSATVSQGSVVSQPAVGGTGNLTWNPGSVAASATVTLKYRVDVTPTSTGQRIPLVGTVASGNGTRGQWLDETGKAAQSRATYLFGPLCEIAVTQQAPTAVDLVEFSATQDGEGVLLQWQTGFEADNLGFHLYRDEGGNRTPVNAQLIAGSALTTGIHSVLQSGERYVWRDHTPSKDASYWLEDIDLNGASTWHGPFGVTPNATAATLLQNNSAELIHQGENQDSPAAASRVVEATAPLPRPARPTKIVAAAVPPTSTQAAVKLFVTHEGWYRVTQAELVKAGFSANVETALLQLYVDGQEQPIWISTNKDGRSDDSLAIEFYGMGVNTTTSPSRVYWLVVGSRPGKRLPQTKVEAKPVALTSFSTTVERRDRTIYFSSLRNGDVENFFGAVIAAKPVVQELQLPHVDLTASRPAELTVALQGVTLVSHRVAVQLNGQVVGEVLIDRQKAASQKFSVPHSWLREGSNQVQLVAVNSANDINLVDSLRLTYQHTFNADDDALKLTVNGKASITIDGFTSAAIRVLDVTDANNVKELQGKVEETKQGFAISLIPGDAGPRNLLALTDRKMQTVAAIKAEVASNWRTTNQAADFVIITCRDFFPALEVFTKVRQSQGYRVALIDVEDLYDEFAYGQKTPQAIKDFLLFARANWQSAPKFLLLAGDASYDPKNYLGAGNFDFVPTKLWDSATMETATDDWFADFNNDGISDLPVGRLPIRSLTEANLLVNKIINYGSQDAASSALLVSDANDGFNFEQSSTRLRQLLPVEMSVQEIDRGQMDTRTAKQLLLEGFSQGQRLINYAGHGSVNLWRGNLLTAAEARALTNGGRLPVLVSMSCLNGYFQDPVLESLGESLLKAEQGGAVAVWASSATTSPEAQAQMNQQFFRNVFVTRTIGEAISRAKQSIRDEDVRRSWIYLGDPTMVLR
ncbi:MAG: hypothetical protein HY231_24315 [Acidobacteria bacterium]|nr:hypothetical protein [Acidobacteriota bacterium]